MLGYYSILDDNMDLTGNLVLPDADYCNNYFMLVWLINRVVAKRCKKLICWKH